MSPFLEVEPSVTAIPDSERAWFEHSLLAVLPDLLSTGLRLTRNPADAKDSDTPTQSFNP